MNRAQAQAAKAEREEAARMAKERAEFIEQLLIGGVIIGAVVILGVLIYFTMAAMR